MTEGKQRCDVGVVVMLIADVQTLAVEDFEVLTWPVVPRRSVLDAFRECCLWG